MSCQAQPGFLALQIICQLAYRIFILDGSKRVLHMIVFQELVSCNNIFIQLFLSF